MTIQATATGFGIAGALDHRVVREIAPVLEGAGFTTLWVNDTPDGDSLASLAVAAEVTTGLRLATGVISVDRRSPEAIIEAVERLGLPVPLLTIGVGSSAPPSPLGRIGEAIERFQASLACPVMVGALGPRMRRLGVTAGDGVLLNWLTPDAARQAVADKDEAIREHGGTDARTALYVRTALGEPAGERLRAEAHRYEGIPSYAANFRRLGVRGVDTAILATTPDGIRDGLAKYEGTVDEVVVRAITANDTLAEYLTLIEAITGAPS